VSFVSPLVAIALCLSVLVSNGCLGSRAIQPMYQYGDRKLTAADCKVHIVLSTSTFVAPNELRFSIDQEEEGLFREVPDRLGLSVENADATEQLPRRLAPRTGRDFVPIISPIDRAGWMWTHVVDPGPRDKLRTIHRGRYRIVLRYLPGPGYSGSDVCIAKSEEFVVLEDGVM
jgi:hypothetical protein